MGNKINGNPVISGLRRPYLYYLSSDTYSLLQYTSTKLTNGTKYNNMSDLAPFVAAVIRDKCVKDLQAENESLRAAGETVEISNLPGTQVYARGKLTGGFPAGSGEHWQVKLEQLAPCPLADIHRVQVRLGGIPLLDSGCIDRTACWVLGFVVGCYDFETQLGLMEWDFRTSQSVSSLSIRCGPFESLDEYESTDDGYSDRTNPFLCRHLRQQANDYPESYVEFRSVSLELPQMLPYLARYGISEEYATSTPPFDSTAKQELPPGWYYNQNGQIRVNRNYPDPPDEEFNDEAHANSMPVFWSFWKWILKYGMCPWKATRNVSCAPFPHLDTRNAAAFRLSFCWESWSSPSRTTRTWIDLKKALRWRIRTPNVFATLSQLSYAPFYALKERTKGVARSIP